MNRHRKCRFLGDALVFSPQIRVKFYSFLSDWLYALVFAGLFFLISLTNGWRVLVAFQHNLGLNDVVTWTGRGPSNIHQEYVSALIVYSGLWFIGGMAILFAKWLYDKK